jgi:hypothetical protein
MGALDFADGTVVHVNAAVAAVVAVICVGPRRDAKTGLHDDDAGARRYLGGVDAARRVSPEESHSGRRGRGHRRRLGRDHAGGTGAVPNPTSAKSV